MFSYLMQVFIFQFEAERPVSEIFQEIIGHHKDTARSLENHAVFQRFHETMKQQMHDTEVMSADLDETQEFVVQSQQISIICPITRQPMQHPVRIKKCGHTFERAAIERMIKGQGIKCPKAGCGNKRVRKEDLEVDVAMEREIRRQRIAGSKQTYSASVEIDDAEEL